VSRGRQAHKTVRANRDRPDLKVQRANQALPVLKERKASKVLPDRRAPKANRDLLAPRDNRDLLGLRDNRDHPAPKAIQVPKDHEVKKASKALRAQLAPLVPHQRDFMCSGKIPVTPTAVATSNAVLAKSLPL
jgi:hypothetical protein